MGKQKSADALRCAGDPGTSGEDGLVVIPMRVIDDLSTRELTYKMHKVIANDPHTIAENHHTWSVDQHPPNTGRPGEINTFENQEPVLDSDVVLNRQRAIIPWSGARSFLTMQGIKLTRKQAIQAAYKNTLYSAT